MKATVLLQRQHRKVETIFKKLEGGKGDNEALLTELANDLAAHMAIEQSIFYPAVREVKEDIIAESFEEHAIAEIALKRLLATSPNDPLFVTRVRVLKELIMHHVKEEEEELFPEVEEALGEEKLNMLGKQMKAEFDADVEKGFEALVPKPTAKTSADATNPMMRRRSSNGAAIAR